MIRRIIHSVYKNRTDMQILLDPTNEWATSQYKIPPTVKNPKQKKELNNWWAEQLQSGETYRYPYGMWTGWSHR